MVKAPVGKRLELGLVLELPGHRPALDLYHPPLPMYMPWRLLGGP